MEGYLGFKDIYQSNIKKECAFLGVSLLLFFLSWNIHGIVLNVFVKQLQSRIEVISSL